MRNWTGRAVFNLKSAGDPTRKKLTLRKTPRESMGPSPTIQSTELFKLEKSVGQKNFVEMELTIIPRNDFKFESVRLAENNRNELNSFLYRFQNLILIS